MLKRVARMLVVVPIVLALGISPAHAARPAHAIVQNYGTCVRVLTVLGFDPTFNEILTPAEFARMFEPLEINPGVGRPLSPEETAVACEALFFFPR